MNEIESKILEKNSFYNLEFDEKEHKYSILLDGEKIILPSVTTLISNYFPFKVQKIAGIVAEKNWTSKDEVIDFWKSLADVGTHVHEIADRFCKGEKLSIREEELMIGLKNFFEEYDYFEILASEIRLCSPKLNVAGTIDVLVKDKRNDRIYTIDWKTSKRSISRQEVYGFALKPFNYLPKGKFFIYSMQVWGYNLILKEEYGIEVFDSLIVRLLPDSYEVVEPYCMLDDITELFELENEKNSY